ncbi:MAG: DUF3341 domain-containing protein [Planctomycetota bacterium]
MSSATTDDPGLHGVMAEYADEHSLIAGIERAKADGFTDMEAYTPVPSHDVINALGVKNRFSMVVFCGGVTGACAGLLLQYVVSVSLYPMNIGGRPYFSWPAFIVIMFECTILFAALSAVIGMLFLNGLPQPYHPVFNVPQFARASQDRFFLVVHATDPRFEPRSTMERLLGSHPLSVAEVVN